MTPKLVTKSHLYASTTPLCAHTLYKTMMAAIVEHTGAISERTDGNRRACSNGQIASGLHPGIFMTKIIVTLHPVTHDL